MIDFISKANRNEKVFTADRHKPDEMQYRNW